MSESTHDHKTQAPRRRPSRQEVRRAAGYQTPESSSTYVQGAIDTSISDAVQGLINGAYGMFAKRIELTRHRLVQDGQGLLDQASERAESALNSGKEIGISIVLLFACVCLVLVGVCTLQLAIVLLVNALAQPAWATPLAIGCIAFVDLGIGAALGLVARKRLLEGKRLLDEATANPSDSRAMRRVPLALPEDRSQAPIALPSSQSPPPTETKTKKETLKVEHIVS